MKNSHKHPEYKASDGLLGRWQLPIELFWRTHAANNEKQIFDYPDFYIFHNTNDLFKNIVLTSTETVQVMHRRIDDYLSVTKRTEIEKSIL